MPSTSASAWADHISDCPFCISGARDEMTTLRCAVATVLQHGTFMACDDIPLMEIVTNAGDYLCGLASSPGGDQATPVPPATRWDWLDAEVRRAVALAAGAEPASALDPCIDDALAQAAQWPSQCQQRLFERAARQFTEQHATTP
ncbi:MULTISPECIES: hypothetical protein [Streptomyces]|uniref:hypothetical protein n=1 Tax=Streptomyces TaxID=1883 RepID=UPI000AF78F3D